MADNADQPKRSQDAKDRSRAQSRAVSGKEAARGTGGSRTATKPGSQKGTGQGNAGPAKGAQSGRGPAAKGGAGKGGNGKGPGNGRRDRATARRRPARAVRRRPC